MNQRGFGVIAMLGFCCFLGICLLTSAYYYKKLMNNANNYYVVRSVSTSKVPYRMENDYSAVSTLSTWFSEYHY